MTYSVLDHEDDRISFEVEEPSEVLASGGSVCPEPLSAACGGTCGRRAGARWIWASRSRFRSIWAATRRCLRSTSPRTAGGSMWYRMRGHFHRERVTGRGEGGDLIPGQSGSPCSPTIQGQGGSSWPQPLHDPGFVPGSRVALPWWHRPPTAVAVSDISAGQSVCRCRCWVIQGRSREGASHLRRLVWSAACRRPLRLRRRPPAPLQQPGRGGVFRFAASQPDLASSRHDCAIPREYRCYQRRFSPPRALPRPSQPSTTLRGVLTGRPG